MTLVGVFGGAFDPVHCGHLRAMVELQEALALDEVRVVPNGTPPHRSAAIAPADARLAMLREALRDMPDFVVDERELRRPGPSYTVDTLLSLRDQKPDAGLCLLVGHDAYAGLASWHRWRELFELAHVVVARRPGARVELEPALAAETAARRCGAPRDLRGGPAGAVLFCDTTPLEISSSDLRQRAAAGRSLRWLVPDGVARLLVDGNWYGNGRDDD